MTRYFSNLWTRREIEFWQEDSKKGVPKVKGSYSDRYRARNVSAGDVIYIWAFFDSTLYLYNRFTVKQVKTVPRSSNGLGKRELAVAKTPSVISFGISLSPAHIKNLEFMPDQRPPKYKKAPNQNDPDPQTFRGIREISSNTAALLDSYLKLARQVKGVKFTATPVANDLQVPPSRIKTTINRIIRDTATSKQLKEDYDYQCQVCNETIDRGQGQKYAEVHHLQPLGGNHAGLDSRGNMLVLCPNHHAMFDFGIPVFKSNRTVTISGKDINLTSKHAIDRKSIDYYMKSIVGKSSKIL